MLNNKALVHYYSNRLSLLYYSEPVLASVMGVDYVASARFDEQSPSFTKGL